MTPGQKGKLNKLGPIKSRRNSINRGPSPYTSQKNMTTLSIGPLPKVMNFEQLLKGKSKKNQ